MNENLEIAICFDSGIVRLEKEIVDLKALIGKEIAKEWDNL